MAMNTEMGDLWDAMKSAKYASTHDDIVKIIDKNYEDPARTVSLCLNAVCNAVHAAAGSFWFYDKYGLNVIRSLAQFGGSDLGDVRIAPGNGICGRVIETGKEIIVAKVEKNSDWYKGVDESTGFQTKTMICVPLKSHDFTFGCIQILNKTDNTAFDEKDLSLAKRLAEEISELIDDKDLLRGFGYNSPRGALEYILNEAMRMDTDEDAIRFLKSSVIFNKLGRFKRWNLKNNLLHLRHHIGWTVKGIKL